MSVTVKEMKVVLDKINGWERRVVSDEQMEREAMIWADGFADRIDSLEAALARVDQWYTHQTERMRPAHLVNRDDVPWCGTCGGAHYPNEGHPPFDQWPNHKALSSPFYNAAHGLPGGPRSMSELTGLPECKRCGYLHTPGGCPPGSTGPSRPAIGGGSDG